MNLNNHRKNNSEKSELIYVTGLWKRTSKSGIEYYGGEASPDLELPAGPFAVLIFLNTFKTSDRDPDYKLYVAPLDEQPKQAGPPQQVEDDGGWSAEDLGRGSHDDENYDIDMEKLNELSRELGLW